MTGAMVADATSPRPRRGRALAEALLVVAAAAAYLSWLQFQTPYLTELDGHFHIQVARQIRLHGILRAFPWAAFSLWRDHYFDKELLYHLALVPFAGGDLVRGAKLAAVLFGAGFFLSFHLVLRFTGLRHAWFWTLLLLVGSGGYFGWRVGLTRPHVLSMALSLWTLALVVRNAPLRLAATSAVYALSYTAPHVAIGYAGYDLVVHRARGGAWRWRLLLAATAGVALGWALHPHARSALIFWKVQVVDVLLNGWRLSGPDLHLGGELKPAPLIPFLREDLLPLLAMAAAVAVAWRLRPRLPEAFWTVALAAAGWFAFTCASKRFVEYWVPCTLWACAWVLEEGAARWRELWPWAAAAPGRRRVLAGVLAAGLAALAARSVAEHVRLFGRPRASGAEPAAAWLREHTPEGSLVFTCDWDDTPELFFHDDRNRYLVMLDPNLMYRWRPEVWTAWDRIANGRDAEPPSTTISRLFGARHGFCTNDFTALRGQLQRDPRARIVLRSPGGYVFELDPPPAPATAAP